MPYISRRRISPPSNRKENEDRRNKKWQKYYGSLAWKKLRNWHIANFPLCHDCAINGISRAATEVHHSIPWSWWTSQEDRMNALLCPDLLVSLCSECHDKRHKCLKKPENFEETKEYKMIHNS